MTDLRRRERLASPPRLFVYVGLPVLFLVAAGWISYRYTTLGEDRSFNYRALFLPAALVLIGLWLGRRHRYRPARWAWSGTWPRSRTCAR